MNKTILFTKMSFSYWLHHKKRLLVFMVSILLGCIALYSTGMLIRSNKQSMMDNILTTIGDYDYIIHDISQEGAERISELEQVDDHGMFYRLGYVISGSGTRSGAACFEDTHSEEIYHMSCEYGRYPQRDNEIAIDLRTAQQMGIYPQVGNNISLTLYSYDGNAAENSEYTICGIYKMSDPHVGGGWRRYPTKWQEEEPFEMPGIFFNSGHKNICGKCNVTQFLQCENNHGISTVLRDELGISEELFEATLGRIFAYNKILGLSQFQEGSVLAEKYGGVTLSNTIEAMKNGDARSDFYSAVLMPVFSAMIGVIVIISIAGITKNIIRDKQESFAVMRSLGLENRQLILYVIIDFMLMTVICILIGLALGAAVHIGMIYLLNQRLNLHLVTAYECSEAVNAATHDPLLMTVIVILLSVLLTVTAVPLKYIGKTPIALFDTQNFGKHKKKGSKRIITKSWKRLVSRRLKMHSHGAAVIAAVVMGAALFGFTYFHALSVKDNGTIESNLESYGLEGFDHTANINEQSNMYLFNIENQHDCGIDPAKAEELADKPFVTDSLGKIVSRSTRVSFKSDELDNDAKRIWSEFDLRTNKILHEDDEYQTAVYESENAMINAVGYSDDEEIYYAPTTGLSENELKKLEKNVIDGRIDIDKLNSGEEVIIAVSKKEQERFAPLFKAGDTIPLSDIKLNEKEENIDFSNIQPEDLGEPVYKKNVKAPDGSDMELRSYSFGQRCDIDPRVGAVLALDDEQTERYLVLAGEDHYGINLLCSYSEFAAWGLPNNKLTSLSIKTDSNKASIKEIDECWYNAISNAQGISFSSSTDIINEVVSETDKTMSVYYCMMAVLILLSAVTTAMILYTNIRIKSSKFAIMRACGMSVGQITYIVIKHNMLYPIIGIIFSLIPTAVCNRFLSYVREQIQSGNWSLDKTSGEDPWYLELPWHADLFSYKVPQALIIIFLIYVVLMLAVALPQMYYISKSSITKELEGSEF